MKGNVLYVVTDVYSIPFLIQFFLTLLSNYLYSLTCILMFREPKEDNYIDIKKLDINVRNCSVSH